MEYFLPKDIDLLFSKLIAGARQKCEDIGNKLEKKAAK
jgi:hypothetical protein